MDKGRHPQVVRTWKVERIRPIDRKIPASPRKGGLPRPRTTGKA